jgi:hypothetical protein
VTNVYAKPYVAKVELPTAKVPGVVHVPNSQAPLIVIAMSGVCAWQVAAAARRAQKIKRGSAIRTPI